LSFDDWKEGHIRPAQAAIRVVAPRLDSKPEPVSPRLMKTLIHTHRQALIGTLFFAPDGKWIAGCGLYGRGGLQIWDAATGKQLRNIPFPDDYLSQYEPLPAPRDGHTFYVPIQRDRSIPITKEGHPEIRRKVDGEIQVWDLATGRKLAPLRPMALGGVLGVALSADGNSLAAVERRVNDDGTKTKDVLTLWDVRTRIARDLADGRRHVVPSFAPDGKSLAAPFTEGESKRSALALWDVPTGNRRTILHSGTDYYGVPVFSPDGRYVAVDMMPPKGRSPEVKVWEVATGQEIGAFTAPEEALSFHQLAFSPDGRRLAAAAEERGEVFLYDMQTRKLSWVKDVGRNTMLRDPAFSADGKWLALPGQPLPEGLHHVLRENPLELPQPRVFLFDLTANSQPEVIVAPHGFVGRAAFSPDSRTLALGGYGCVWLFDVPKAAK
jgi:WD40 repeat protein